MEIEIEVVLHAGFLVFPERNREGGREGGREGLVRKEGWRDGGMEGGVVAYLGVEDLGDLAPVAHPVGFQCCALFVCAGDRNMRSKVLLSLPPPSLSPSLPPSLPRLTRQHQELLRSGPVRGKDGVVGVVHHAVRLCVCGNRGGI